MQKPENYSTDEQCVDKDPDALSWYFMDVAQSRRDHARREE